MFPLSAGQQQKIYVDDVFSAFTYTGNGSAQTINNGINLSGYGGMVIEKRRNSVSSNYWTDTARGMANAVVSDGPNAQITLSGAAGTTGYTSGITWGSGDSIISRAFRKAPKFFDVVTYTGNGVSGRSISHGLGTVPGMIIVKSLNLDSNWFAYHRSTAYAKYLQFNSTATEVVDSAVWTTEPTATAFTVGNIGSINNANGISYVAYVFAHDTSVDGMIQCGSYVGGYQTITNTVYSSGSVTIPANVTSITLTGTGGTGGDNTTYDPGQPYIEPGYYDPGQPYVEPGYYDPGQPYVAPTAATYKLTTESMTIGSNTGSATQQNPVNGACTGGTTGGFEGATVAQQDTSYRLNSTEYSLNFTTNTYWTVAVVYKVVVKTAATPGQPYIAPRNGQPYIAPRNGQPYIAPSSSGGPYSGVNTTATINGATHTYSGGYGGAASPVTETFTIPNASQTLSYSIAVGGSITYSYVIAGTPAIDLGWEPQFVMVKNTSSTGNWVMLDVARGMTAGAIDEALQANTSSAATTVTAIAPNARGFSVVSSAADFGAVGNTYIYMAIRRPNKPPTNGAQVYSSITYTANNTQNRSISGAGFAPDFALAYPNRTTGGFGYQVHDRLRGGGLSLNTSSTSGDVSRTPEGLLTQDGMVTDSAYGFMNAGGASEVIHFFKRAPGFFDEVCYTGTGTTNNINHSLSAVPELIIAKARDGAYDWYVASGFTVSGDKTLRLNTTVAQYGEDWPAWLGTSAPTATQFSVYPANLAQINGTGAKYVAYLFASLAGISKIFTYTGNGTSQTIPCGFSNGARFILLKRTDAAGDWFVWDTSRGITAGNNDPHLSMNTTAVEVITDDSISPHASGFIANQVTATNINVTGATYIGLAIA